MIELLTAIVDKPLFWVVIIALVIRYVPRKEPATIPTAEEVAAIVDERIAKVSEAKQFWRCQFCGNRLFIEDGTCYCRAEPAMFGVTPEINENVQEPLRNSWRGAPQNVPENWRFSCESCDEHFLYTTAPTCSHCGGVIKSLAETFAPKEDEP